MSKARDERNTALAARDRKLKLSAWLREYAGEADGTGWHARMTEAARIVAIYEAHAEHDQAKPELTP